MAVRRRRDFRPTSSARVRGALRVRRLVVPARVTVTLAAGAKLHVAESATIGGTLRAAAGITLVTGGDLTITGALIAANGHTGASAGVDDARHVAIAGHGEAGGGIALTSTGGAIVLGRRALLRAGDGGDGGDATAIARAPRHAVAVGGRGGDGGDIALSAPRGVTLPSRRGVLRLGDGGAGGRARARRGSGGAYVRGGDGGHSGTIDDAALTIQDARGRTMAATPALLRRLVAGGRGGDGGDARG